MAISLTMNATLQYTLVEKPEDVAYEEEEEMGAAIFSENVENPILSQPFLTQDLNFLNYGRTMSNINAKKQKK